jgi:hypothetical protein
MCATSFLRSVSVSTRRLIALSLFRLASMVLRGTTRLYERHAIPRSGVKAGLSISGALERGATGLLPELSRGRRRDGCKEVRP